MEISIAEAHNRLSHWLRQVQHGPIRITRHGKVVGVLIDPEEYEHFSQVQAYLQMISLSKTLRESGARAKELYRSGREELEDRG